MELNPVASSFLVFGYLVLSLMTAGAFIGIAVGLSKLNSKLEDLVQRLDPVLARTEQVLTTSNDKIASIGDKAEEILVQGEEVAESVHQKVDKTATAVQRTIHAPLIGLNSFAAGVARGVETFGRLQRAPESNGVAAVAIGSAEKADGTGGADQVS